MLSSIKRLIAIQTGHDPMPHELADWVHQLPQIHQDLDKKLRASGIVRSESGSGRRPLSELLYGMIEPTERFEEMVRRHHRNGNSEADARRKGIVEVAL